jgi:pyruvate/2-oxoglutarate dehydrogenase complex dihydrolipoamide acyltransferase (E2) component
MRISLKLSKVGMSMQEATIAKWHKSPGDSFVAGDVLYEIETEKVTQEITAPGAGRLLEVAVPAGQTVEVGGVVCVVDMTPA